MKKSIPFELFGPNQFIMFDIQRLAELERALGRDITSIIRNQYAGIDFCLAALPIGMRQHYKSPAVFIEKIQTHLENGGSIDDIAVPIIKAIVASGILGKDVSERLSSEDGNERKNVKEETEE